MSGNKKDNSLEAILLECLRLARISNIEMNRTKLQKLLYLADLESNEKNHCSLTGLHWVWHNYGPFDSTLMRTEESLDWLGKISSESRKSHGDYTEFVLSICGNDWELSESYVSDWLEQELRDAFDKYGHLTASQLKKLSYQTPPMVLAQQGNGQRGETLDMTMGTTGTSTSQRRKRASDVLKKAKARRRSLDVKDEGDLSEMVKENDEFSLARATANSRLLERD